MAISTWEDIMSSIQKIINIKDDDDSIYLLSIENTYVCIEHEPSGESIIEFQSDTLKESLMLAIRSFELKGLFDNEYKPKNYRESM
jgi:hypothetical protein